MGQVINASIIYSDRSYLLHIRRTTPALSIRIEPCVARDCKYCPALKSNPRHAADAARKGSEVTTVITAPYVLYNNVYWIMDLNNILLLITQCGSFPPFPFRSYYCAYITSDLT